MWIRSDAARLDRPRLGLGEDEGGKLVCGGADAPEDLGAGFHVRPTIFAGVDNGWRIAQEEIFGPALVIVPFDSEDEAVKIANDSPYGLAGGVWSHWPPSGGTTTGAAPATSA